MEIKSKGIAECEERTQWNIADEFKRLIRVRHAIYAAIFENELWDYYRLRYNI